MKVNLLLEHRFKRDGKGNVYASSNSVTIDLWIRYLKVFEHLTVWARIRDVEEKIDKGYLVTYPSVTFKAIPYYVGAKEFLKKYYAINKFIKVSVSEEDAYVCRLPSLSGTLLIKQLLKKRIPYVVELVGDPWDLYQSGIIKNNFALFHKYRSYFTLKKSVYNASGVIYVTKQMLQRRYPARKGVPTTHASNVIIHKLDIKESPKKIGFGQKKINLLSIGSLEQLYKSPDIVLKALKELNIDGCYPYLTWLGDGKFKQEMTELAIELGIQQNVNFRGNVPHKEVEREFERADIYIHVSRTEGLPRALIEAMAQGLPCIATKVGGIPELIEQDFLINVNDIAALVQRIELLVRNPDKAFEQASANLRKANDFEFNELEKRREKIYRVLLK